MASVKNLLLEQETGPTGCEEEGHDKPFTFASSGYSRNSCLSCNSTPAKSLTIQALTSGALQNLSSPVQNAMRIRIDQDKKIAPPFPFLTVRLLPTTSSVDARNVSGLPKRGASFPITHPPTTTSNFCDSEKKGRFCIPKKIDTATNTDKEVAVPSRMGMHSTYTRPGSNANPCSVIPNTLTKSASCSKNIIGSGPHVNKSQYTFSSAWSPAVFDPYFADEKVGSLSNIKNATPISLQSQHRQNGNTDNIPSKTLKRQSFLSNNSCRAPSTTTAGSKTSRMPIYKAKLISNGSGPYSARFLGQTKGLKNGESTNGLHLKTNASSNDPLFQVNAVFEEVKDLEKGVDEFAGNSIKDKRYLVLDEMLTRCLIKLDKVNTEGRVDVMKARKESIKYIESCISKLENKASLCEK